MLPLLAYYGIQHPPSRLCQNELPTRLAAECRHRARPWIYKGLTSVLAITGRMKTSWSASPKRCVGHLVESRISTRMASKVVGLCVQIFGRAWAPRCLRDCAFRLPQLSWLDLDSVLVVTGCHRRVVASRAEAGSWQTHRQKSLHHQVPSNRQRRPSPHFWREVLGALDAPGLWTLIPGICRCAFISNCGPEMKKKTP